MESSTEIDSCIKFLEENEFIRLQHMDSGLRYSATQLGEFCYQDQRSGFLVHYKWTKSRKYGEGENC